MRTKTDVEKNIDDTDTNAFRYCGEYYDKETATIYLRARYYSPSTGRFISRDSFAGSNNDPLSLNLYTYFHNNHISGTDSTGHFLDTLLDIASLAYDIYSFAKDPTPSGALDVALDIVGLAAPGIPRKAGAHLAGAAYGAYKAAGATHGLSKAVGVVAAVSKNGNTALKLTDTVKDAKKASKIARTGYSKLSSDALTQGKKVFPKNSDDLLPEIPRTRVTKANGTTSQIINTSDNLRIRAEKHPIKPGETYNPRHHGTHYHVEYRIDTRKSWNNSKNVRKIYPDGYTKGSGTGFLPGEAFPGRKPRR